MSEVSIQPEVNQSPKMNEFLNHHGIKGMKWGVRRTPEQLGHATARKQSGGENKPAKKIPAKKTPGKSARSSSSLSDDELQKRINRLNMEERYEDLVARQKARGNTGFKATAKKLVGNAAEDLGRQLLSKAVSKLVDRIAGDKKFDIEDFRDMDVNDMDTDTIAKVAKWYGDAMKINTSRSKLVSDNSTSSSSSSAAPASATTSTPKPTSSKSPTDYTRRPPRGDNRSSSRRTSQKQLDEWIRQRNRAMRDLNR